ncbi:MAG: hypothetical protein E3J35_01325 [Methanomassiliicoccales archaeon]|nr:MAG: hypothetical protein E3J35_01325 [Methanomassiliicoccales archaeon]
MTEPQTPPPETPAKGTSNKLIAIIVIIVIIATVVPITLFLLLQPPPPTDGDNPPPAVPPAGQFIGVYDITDNSATVRFGQFSYDPAPVWVKIVMETSTLSGSYNFPSNSDGVTLTHHGLDIGTIVYRDYADDQLISAGDELLLSGLSASSDYTVKLVWVATGDLIDSIGFSTTA